MLSQPCAPPSWSFLSCPPASQAQPWGAGPSRLRKPVRTGSLPPAPQPVPRVCAPPPGSPTRTSTRSSSSTSPSSSSSSPSPAASSSTPGGCPATRGRTPLPAGAGAHPLCPLQGDGRRLQLPAGLVLLHAHHPREHPHQQRLPVREAGAGLLRGGGGAGDWLPPTAAWHPVPKLRSLGAEGTE